MLPLSVVSKQVLRESLDCAEMKFMDLYNMIGELWIFFPKAPSLVLALCRC